MKLDHVMYAASDLKAGMDQIERQLGVRPEPGGRHEGAGTHNALLGLGDEVYLEVIAPDPEQSLQGTLGESLSRIKEPGIRTWAVAVNGFEPLSKQAQAAGLRYKISDMSRLRPDGVLLEWQLMFLGEHDFGTAMPFFIDWQQSPHPCLGLNSEIRYQSFSVASSASPGLDATLRQIGLGEYVGSLRADRFELVLDGPNGSVTLN